MGCLQTVEVVIVQAANTKGLHVVPQLSRVSKQMSFCSESKCLGVFNQSKWTPHLEVVSPLLLLHVTVVARAMQQSLSAIPQ